MVSAGDTPDRTADVALRVTVAESWAEVVGAILMERLGPFVQEPADADSDVTMIFYPEPDETPSAIDLWALLPGTLQEDGRMRVERREVPRDWVDGWKQHFRPLRIGRVRVRPPWEPPLDPSTEGEAGEEQSSDQSAGGDRDSTVDVVINPGLGFGTGLHPTTRSTLMLLQAGPPPRGAWERSLGRVVDAGTGSGILAVAAAKLGWGPILAFDNDPLALTAARENLAANGVADAVDVRECGVEDADPTWFAGTVVLANMTLAPVLTLVRLLAPATADRPCGAQRPRDEAAALPRRLVVSGILAGSQEDDLLIEARRCGYLPGSRLYEGEWVTMELQPHKTRTEAAPSGPKDGTGSSAISVKGV